MRAFHDASYQFDSAGLEWSREMADTVGGPVVCHNDVCLENVVFREGVAIGLLDFDFAARADLCTTSCSLLACAFPSMTT